MTILAGALARHGGATIRDDLCASLRAAISRSAGDAIVEARTGRGVLMKVDVGAFGDPAHLVDASGAATFVAGEPLLGDADVRTSRAADVARLNEGWRSEDDGPLRETRGVFSAAHLDASGSRLTLATDRLGVRPLYYWIGDDHVVFASALRILEAMPLVPKTMDVRSVAEVAGLGMPLGIRTPYAGISLMRAGEVMRVSQSGITRSQYWRWDDRAPTTRPEAELRGEVYDRFAAAVRRRLGGDRSTAAFLSGGLDSRSIVALLRETGARVRTFTFALPGTQDQRLAAELARAAGTDHEEAPLENPTDPSWSMLMSRALASSGRGGVAGMERPRLVWSGDGGSVTLGHVYIGREVAARLRAGDQSGAIRAFLAQQGAGLLKRLFHRDVAASLADVLHAGIEEELADIRGDDPVRRFHLFLMLNDQRRHLSRHFESIDLHRLEFHLPFFDGDFVGAVLGAPAEPFLSHAFYVRWLDQLPTYVRSVAWQAYPGHVPCPVPMPEGLGYQWDPAHGAARRAIERRALLRDAGALLRARDFPRPLMQKGYLRLATWAHRAGIRDFSYAITTARLFHGYWSACAGRYVLPR